MKQSFVRIIGHWLLVISAVWVIGVSLLAWATDGRQTLDIFQTLRLGLPVWHLILPIYGVLSLVLLYRPRPGTYWYVALGHFLVIFVLSLILNITFESVSARTGLKPTIWTTLIVVFGSIGGLAAVFMALGDVVPVDSPTARLAYLGRSGHLRELMRLARERGWQAVGPQLPDHAVLITGSWAGRDVRIHSGQTFLGNESGYFYWVTVAATSFLPAMGVAVGRPLVKPEDRQREVQGRCHTAGKRMAAFYLWPQAGQALSPNAMSNVARILNEGRHFLRAGSIVFADHGAIHYGRHSTFRLTENANQMSELIGWLANLATVLEQETTTMPALETMPAPLPAHETASASVHARPSELGPASLAGRALLAVLLTIGFYGLALAIVAVLLFIVYADIRWASRVNVRLVLGCVLAAGAILWSIVPRRDRFEAPGPRLLPAEHPKLFGEVEAIARQLGQTMPQEIYLVPDMNAGVMERGGVMGIGGKRVMVIGLPLLQALTVAQLRGVIAHEFGHFHGGDTRLSPWIYKTRSAIGRTIQSLGDRSWLQAPFRWYGQLFLRTTHAISRRQEFVADALAARLVGPQVYADALRMIHGFAPAFEGYMREEYIPALENGFLPPFLEGFSRFVHTARISQVIEHIMAEEARSGPASSFDTHPSLAERLAALTSLPASTPSPDVDPATSLLGDVAAAEAALLANMVRPEYRNKLRPVTWDDLGTVAYLPRWEATVRQFAAGLIGHTCGTLPDLLAAPAALEKEIRRLAERTLLQQEVEHAGRQITGVALAVALARQGWVVDATPGIPITLRRENDAVEPFEVVQMLAEGKLSAEAWRQRCHELSITDLKLIST